MDGTDSSAWLSAAEMQILTAVCDALVPSLPPPPGEDDPHGLYARPARELDVAGRLADMLSEEPPEALAGFRRLLRLLDSPVTGVLLAGGFRGFCRMSRQEQETALRRMSTSPVPQLRQGFRVLKRLTMFTFYAAPIRNGRNPNWDAAGYRPTMPQERTPKRLRTVDIAGDLTLTADAIVVGSGAGGGVIAAELAAAGQEVVIVEKGGYFNESDFNGLEAELTPRLFLHRGLLTTHDLSVSVLAGSCVGGGTIVNWSTSLRTQPHVLEEWEKEHGLVGAAGKEYRRGFDMVEQRLGVTTADSVPNRNNAALRRGCDALGYRWSVTPRNASACEQRCGPCTFGCAYSRKQSTMLTFLQDASDRGARLIPGCTVEHVLIEGSNAVGVEGWTVDASGVRRRVVVRAPRVIVAAGAVESPALLLRSGVSNPNIGKHLRLHPVAAVAARYTEPVETWTGSHQTVVCDHFATLENGYGFLIEVAPAHLGTLAIAVPWDTPLAHKQTMKAAAHQAAFISFTRDTGEGSVTADRRGRPILRYRPNKQDQQRLIQGMQEMVRIGLAGGAVEVDTTHVPRLRLETEGHRPGAVSERQLGEFLSQIERRGIQSNRVGLFSAHQMGTCRLGSNPRTSVAGPDGQVHGIRGLYIADASGFPSASGVNPMISVMALAYHVAQHVKGHL